MALTVSGALVAIAAGVHLTLCEWTDWADRRPAQRVLLRIGDAALLVRQPGSASRAGIVAVGVAMPAGLVGWAAWLPATTGAARRRARPRRLGCAPQRPSAARVGAFRTLGPRVPACVARLGLTFPCDPDQVRAAYRRLSLRAHPDLGGSAERFVALRAAYEECLKYADATRRRAPV